MLLKEVHHDRRVPYFDDYIKRYSDSPYLVELVEEEGGHRPGQMVRANRLQTYAEVENGDWKFLIWDDLADKPKMPLGASGHRWGKPGQWNLKLEDSVDGSPIDFFPGE